MQKMITWQGEGNTRRRYIATTTMRQKNREMLKISTNDDANYSLNTKEVSNFEHWFTLDDTESITMSDIIWSFVIYGGFAVSAIFTALLFFLT